ncbi:hypothetical protein FA15DRAFT_152397 [Coprinopsis marcescibilis]|uniref:RING-type E3 ubiquitin transferase n=1 Tax=Coprinopsis marcescibilis TaxID=230819 RepID=A0A5C3KIB3_COPMA|nr:hypothetical protein FA15DRAFT_152397 [Coprinopsis marcescibilis]
MPPREPMWYCHECHSEMRPLMVPDPVCASCHGSFVEKLENSEDDPRQFALGNTVDHNDDNPPAPSIDAFLLSLQALMDRGMSQRQRLRPDGSSPV